LEIPIRLLYSNRSEEEIVYRAELQALADRNPWFQIRITLTGTPPGGWNGSTGRVSARWIGESTSDIPNPLYYVCGTPQFVQDQLALLTSMGVNEADLDWEPFRGY
jgi:ferredoxin-NADP reductase